MELPENPDKPNNFLVSRRAREVSQVLTDAARVARFSSRARSAAQSSGYVSRRGDKLLRFIKIASIVLIVIIPNIISVLYFGLFASNQYVSETKFTVASGTIPKMDGIGSATGLPSTAIFQDSHIIISYIESRALVDALDRELKLRQKYGSEDIDWWSRFNKNKPVEKLVEYWQDHVKVAITAPAGIIKLEVSAFSPKEARDIAETIIAKCELLVNDLNKKIRSDIISLAEAELKRSGERIKNIRIKVESLRNQEGIINTTEATSSLTKILLNLETELLKTRNDYEIERKYVDETAPQLRVMKSKIDTLTLQITNIKNKMTKQEFLKTDNEDQKKLDSVLSKKIKTFSEVELEQRISETSYEQAIKTLEIARQMSEKKLIYLHKIIEPTIPEESSYPRKKILILVLFFSSSILCFVLNKFVNFTRDHLA